MNDTKQVRERVWLALAPTLLACLCGCGDLRRSAPGRVMTTQEPEYRRSYALYAPSGYQHERRWPLVIICHDRGMFEGPAREIDDWKRAAEKHGVLLAAPNFQRKDKPGSKKLPAEKAASEDEAFMLSVIRSIRAAYSVDDMRIFLIGSGSGSFPALFFGLRHPDLCRAVSIRQPSLKPEWLDPCVPFLDLYQPIQVVFDPGDLLGSKDVDACIDWLMGQNLNVATVQQSGSRRRDPTAVFAFVSQVLRRQPMIRILLRDDPANNMSLGFRIHTSLNPTKVRWDFGDGANSGEQEPSHTYSQPGLYKVKLSVWSSGGPPHVRQVEVRVPRVWLGARAPTTGEEQ